MNYRFLIVLIFLGLVTGPGAGGFAYGQAVSSWAGSFYYEGLDGYDGGGTAATGNPIVLAMTLEIDPEPPRLSRRLQHERGWSIWEQQSGIQWKYGSGLCGWC